jgi:clan AA aspartic protease
MTISMLADSGAYMMGINETIQEQLALPFVEKRKAVLADGSVKEYDVVGPIHVKFKNRTAVCSALVLQGDTEPLLGAIPMEEMDVLIHPHRQELIVKP